MDAKTKLKRLRIESSKASIATARVESGSARESSATAAALGVPACAAFPLAPGVGAAEQAAAARVPMASQARLNRFMETPGEGVAGAAAGKSGARELIAPGRRSSTLAVEARFHRSSSR